MVIFPNSCHPRAELEILIAFGIHRLNFSPFGRNDKRRGLLRTLDNPFYHKQLKNYAIIDGIVKEKLEKNRLQENFY